MGRQPSAWPQRLAILAYIGLVPLAIWTLFAFNGVTLLMGMFDLGVETKKFASELYFNKMTALAQLSIALLGAVWAFVTLSETELSFRDWPAKHCFALANLSLLASLAVYAYGYDLFVARIFHHGTFDIDAPVARFVSLHQQLWFAAGSIVIAFTIITGRAQE